MAPPSSPSTITTRSVSKKKETVINGQGQGQATTEAAKPDGQNDVDIKRDPLEITYKDFFWTYTEEPHRTRRLAIIKAHPEVRYPNLLRAVCVRLN
jgi:sphingolipid 4-desaturase/C4-monooxygenase